MMTDAQICKAAREAFLQDLAGDTSKNNTIKEIVIVERDEESATVQIVWTFENADLPGPDDAFYAVFYEGDCITLVDGPEW
ncbi:MAG: hypothetical protein ACRDHZ_13980 [Ktedonobacteraceae bacterium]